MAYYPGAPMSTAPVRPVIPQMPGVPISQGSSVIEGPMMHGTSYPTNNLGVGQFAGGVAPGYGGGYGSYPQGYMNNSGYLTTANYPGAVYGYGTTTGYGGAYGAGYPATHWYSDPIAVVTTTITIGVIHLFLSLPARTGKEADG
ncbi:hypothetical protein K435DRAFT_836663 [Dendrothele bispora CBS 962.96]|uniref:Uncharacterized protein n=1 Tax=Dendrothele bispora (strain CBS 962.96) TaxID=1314807 RepID=A0A4S8MH14_DENBC|nr:hypothetical protein K435DRAFT_836663 [Dendrothele bispora CBS 962.96]